MIGRSETMIKWALFAAVTVPCLLLQGFVLQFIAVAGVMPFLYPALPATVGMYEGPVGGAVYGLVLGVACDLTLPGPIPCLYTLVFSATGFFSALLVRSWLPAGLPCALLSASASFLLLDLLRCAQLALSGQSVWPAGALKTVQEIALTMPFVIPVWLLFRLVHRKCHLYD